MIDFESVSVNELPLGDQVRLIDSNEDGLVALEKPTGVMSHPNREKNIGRSLLTASYDYDQEYFFWNDAAGVERKAWLVNRLDSPTSGIILLALNPEINALIKEQFATHRVSKTYYALVKNKPSSSTGVWNDVLTKDIVRNGKTIKNAKRIPAKSRFIVLKQPIGGFPVSLLKLIPVTGRTHQLRIQCRRHKLPIVGDKTYGSFSFNREVKDETGEDRLMLHSGETMVKYAINGQSRTFTAKSDLPEAFHAVLNFRPGRNAGQTVLPNRRFKRP